MVRQKYLSIYTLYELFDTMNFCNMRIFINDIGFYNDIWFISLLVFYSILSVL